jgi:hypothetical protein
MLSSSGTSLDALLHRNVRQSRAPSTPRSRRRSRSRVWRIAFAHTDEFKHTREVHVWLLAQGVDERKWEARRNSNVSSVSQSVGEWSQSADARAFAIESPRAASQRRRTHSKQQVAALVGASLADAGQHGAHSKQLLAAARRELRAARIALGAPLLRRKAHSRAHGTVDGERGAGRRCVFEFAERQSLMCKAVVFWTRASNTCSC